MRQPVESLGGGILFGISAVNAIDIGGLQHRLRTDLGGIYFNAVFGALGGLLGWMLFSIFGNKAQAEDALTLQLLQDGALIGGGIGYLVVSVEAGLGLDQALTRVGTELAFAYPELSDELRLINLELRAGKPRSEALRNLADRTGVDDLSSLVTMLIQTDKFGTSVAQSLRVYSETLRTKRRQRAEEAAAKTGGKMVWAELMLSA